MSKERIFVAYRPVRNTAGLAYHLSLNYIDRKGKHFVIDAGPETVPWGPRAISETFVQERDSRPEDNTDSRFKRLILHRQDSPEIIRQKFNTYRDGRVFTPYTNIISGESLTQLWNKMSNTASSLNKRFEYRSASQNSNTFIGHILRKHGLYRKLDIPDFWPNSKTGVDFTSQGKTNKKSLRIPGVDTNPSFPLSPEIGPQDFKPIPPKGFEDTYGKLNQLSPIQDQASFREKSNSPQKRLHNLPEAAHTPGRVQLAKPRPKPEPEDMPKRGPERVKHDPSYNPYDREANGFDDLEGEAFLFKTDKKRNAASILASGRQKMFSGFFEDIA